MKSSCGLGGAAEFSPEAPASADLATPSADADGGGSSGPRTPHPAIPAARASARTRPKGFASTHFKVCQSQLAIGGRIPASASMTGDERIVRGTSPLVSSVLDLPPVLFQLLEPGPRHFCDVLWRGSPIAGPAFDRIFNGKYRKHGFRDARLDPLHLFE